MSLRLRLTNSLSMASGGAAPAPTNMEANAQAFNLRAQYACSVSADSTADPLGGTTADTVTSTATGAQSAVEAAIAFTADVYTSSIFIHKTAGTAGFAYVQINSGGASPRAFAVNKATGAIGADILGGGTISAQVVDYDANYWRLVLVYTAAAGGGYSYFGPSDAINTRSVTSGASIVGWQSQTILGNYPTGGGIAV